MKRSTEKEQLLRHTKALAQTLAMLVGMSALSARAETTTVKAGTTLEAFSLPDQRDEMRAVDQDTRLLLFSRDKDLAKMAFGVLGAKESSYLADRHAGFILDISPMPRLITWLFAKPKMRKHTFPLLLDAGPTATKAFPSQEGKLTVLHLNNLKVEAVKYVSTPDELKAELDALQR